MARQVLSVMELCDELAERFEALKRPVVARLKPGLSAAELERHERDLKLVFPRDLRELYAWRNGTAGEGVALDDIYFFPWMYFVELGEVAVHYKAILGLPGWKRSWLPIFQSGGAGWLAVDCAGGGVTHWSGGAPAKQHYLSVRSMLETWLECYETGSFFVEGGKLRRKDEAIRQIALSHNPGLDYWQELRARS